MPTSEELQAHEDALTSASTNPAQATVDGVTVRGHSLRERLELDRYLNAKAAAKNGTGLRFQKVKPGSAQ